MRPTRLRVATRRGRSKISLRRRLAIFMRAWLLPVAAIPLSLERSAQRRDLLDVVIIFRASSYCRAQERILFLKISRGDNGNNAEHARTASRGGSSSKRGPRRRPQIILRRGGGRASKEPPQARAFILTRRDLLALITGNVVRWLRLLLSALCSGHCVTGASRLIALFMG